jgi:glycosyltransferase involved in cell wall biosynthesis
MNLLVISHTPHYLVDDQVVGWGSTVREIDHLATLFTEVEHLAPLHPEPAPAIALPYTRNNIRLNLVKPAGGETLWDKLIVLRSIPHWLLELRKVIRAADVIHIRCPAGISLVALISVRFWGKGKPCWVKYAGSWRPEGNQPISYKLQRWLLENNWQHGVVTINGSWPGQANHILTFNNPSLTQDEYAQAHQMAQNKRLTSPIQLLFVGRVDRAKGVDHLLAVAHKLKQQGLPFELTLVGDSPERQKFEAFIRQNHLAQEVNFVGWKKTPNVYPYYQRAHLIIFPSTSEGWPKVLSEAMAHGVVPIASNVGSISQTLTQIGAGKAIPSDQISRYVEVILEYADNPTIWEAERDKCITAGVRYTYPAYLQAVQTLFKQAWQIDLIS